MKKAFTLIELLVVVLIVCILSAVALPQYQKAVLRSRMAEAITTLSSLQKGIDVYVLESPKQSGTFTGTNNSGALSVDISHIPTTNGLYSKSKHFFYQANCNANSKCDVYAWYCPIEATLPTSCLTREDYYTLHMVKSETTGEWTKTCAVYNTSKNTLGVGMCKLAANEGWSYN